MNRNFVILILFLLSFVSFGQIKINGKVTDSLLSPLSYANIQILDSLNKKIYAFGTTKNDGTFSIEISNKGLYKVKASFLGFESKIQKIYADKDTEKINFILTPKTDELKEIIIKYNPDVATVKKDTIIYNLKKLTNGQENNLKEILEKLPGININEQGKVTAFGKKVGKLLIDGEDIFKEQHQFATENITAEMIAGVSFFQKYEGFANIKGFNNDQTTALNINIKDTYKNRITGNVDINGGVLNKYLGHANIFRLGKKLKLTLLSDINNIGKESISFDDYIDLNTTVKSTNFGNSTYYDDNDIPTFLSSTRDVAYREIGFGALNFVYSPKENLKISGYSIFNTTSQNQFFFNTRNFFEDQPDQTENRNIYGDFVFNTTQIKAAYKIGQSTFIQYTITNNPETDNEQFDLTNNFNNRTNIFDQKIRNVNQNLGQEMMVTSKLSSKSLIEFQGYNQYKSSNGNIFINSNNPFLGFSFLDDEFKINQKTTLINRTYGYTFNNKNKSRIGSYDFISGFSYKNQDFNSQLSGGENINTNNLMLKISDSYVGAKFSSNNSGMFSYQVGLEYHYFYYNLNNSENNYRYSIFPSINLNLRSKNNIIFSLSYSYQNEYPPLKTAITGEVVSNYLNKQVEGNADFNEILPAHRIGSTVSWTDFKKGDNFLFSLQYTNKPKSLTQNVSYQANNFTENDFRFTNKDSYIFSTLSFDKNFNKSKLKFSSITLSILNNKGNFINNEENIADSFLIEQSLKLSTNYKQNLNFSTGLSISLLTVNNSLNAIEFTSNSFDPYLGIRSSLLQKRLTVNLDIISKNLKADDLSRSFFVLSPKITYTNAKSRWEFSMTGNNILNLQSPEIVDNVNYNVFYEQRVSRTLEGYLIFGMSYKF